MFFTASDTVEQNASACFRLYDRVTNEIILFAGDEEMKEYINSAPVLKIGKDVLQPKRFFFTDDYNFDDKPDLCVFYAFQQEDDEIYFAYPDHPDKAAMKTSTINDSLFRHSAQR